MPILISLLIALSTGSATDPIPFESFIQSVIHATATDFLGHSGFKVDDAASFEEMRQHILSMYSGVHVNHSYVLDGQTFDCVPIDQQPSVRTRGSKKIAPPPTSQQNAVRSASSCEEHTIPMRRITLQQLASFRTLKESFRKSPTGN